VFDSASVLFSLSLLLFNSTSKRSLALLSVALPARC
jgi:hypothetical protein